MTNWWIWLQQIPVRGGTGTMHPDRAHAAIQEPARFSG